MNFSGIDQLPATLKSVDTYQHFAKGQVLFHRNQKTRVIYAVRAGQVWLVHYTQSGQSISHYTVHSEEICAEVALFLDTFFSIRLPFNTIAA